MKWFHDENVSIKMKFTPTIKLISSDDSFENRWMNVPVKTASMTLSINLDANMNARINKFAD